MTAVATAILVSMILEMLIGPAAQLGKTIVWRVFCVLERTRPCMGYVCKRGHCMCRSVIYV